MSSLSVVSKPSAEERDGEYVDNQGRTYDQMGDPQTSKVLEPAQCAKILSTLSMRIC